MSWNGNIIGSGVNTLERIEGTTLHYNLEFIKPFKSKAKTTFVFEEKDGGTDVTWTMDSSMPFFLFFMVPTMKNWIGMDYNRGLKMLKEMAEKGRVSASTTNNGIVEIKGFSYVCIQRTVHIDACGDYMPKDFNKIVEDIVVKRGKSPQNWVSLYTKMDMKSMMMTYIAAVSDEDLQGVDLGSEYVKGRIDAGRALEIKHDGPYDFIGNAWSMGMMNMRAKKMKQKGVPFEQYWNSPLEVKPEELKSSVFFPLKG